MTTETRVSKERFDALFHQFNDELMAGDRSTLLLGVDDRGWYLEADGERFRLDKRLGSPLDVDDRAARTLRLPDQQRAPAARVTERPILPTRE